MLVGILLAAQDFFKKAFITNVLGSCGREVAKLKNALGNMKFKLAAVSVPLQITRNKHVQNSYLCVGSLPYCKEDCSNDHTESPEFLKPHCLTVAVNRGLERN